MKGAKMLTILVLVLVVAISAVGSTAGKMYWADADTDKIQRANMDGSGVEDLVTGLSDPRGIAIDIAGGKMYWTDSGNDKIQRANLDGSGIEDLVTGLLVPFSIALDVAGGKMYWTDMAAQKIQRANLDGTGVVDILTGLPLPSDIALDVDGGKMYWTDQNIDKIQRANLDGSGVEELVTTDLIGPDGITLYVTTSKMYWVDYGTNKVQRANLDGSGVEDLVTGLSEPRRIAIDVAGGKMYWTDNGTDKIQRANLDGSGVEDLVTGLSYPFGIALVPPIYTFSYQGHLYDNNSVADGLYDFAFKLYDEDSDGNQVGGNVYKSDEDVIDGYFTVELDFGAAFAGDGRWLEIGVRPGQLEDPNDYTTLSPRQEVLPTPYAIYAKTAGYAVTAGGAAGGITGSGTAGYIAKFNDSDTIGDSVIYESGGNVGIGTVNPQNKLDVEGAVAIGASYSGTETAPTNGMVIEGDVGIGTTSPSEVLDVNGNININSVYKIGGATVLSVTDTNNTLVGIGAGKNNIADYGTFVGYNAGYNNHGYYNTFLGDMAGFKNTGYSNTFSGYQAGRDNTTGYRNTFSGYQAGYSNTEGYYNTFSGYQAGYSNTEGSFNTFSGSSAGYNNTTGDDNTFSGSSAGYNNTTGQGNTFSGCGAGMSNTTGYYNTFSGCRAGYWHQTGSRNVFIGYQAGYFESGSNKLYIANSETDANTIIYGDFSTGNIGIGTTNPGVYMLAVNGTAAKPGAGSWDNFSDVRLKKINGNYEHGLSEVSKLNPVRYSYRENNKLQLPAGREFIGVVAQEVQNVIPEAVRENDDRYLMVNNDPIIWSMVNAIKELKGHNEDLKQRVEAMERTIQQLTKGKEFEL